MTFSITKLLIDCVGFSLLLSILLAKFGPTNVYETDLQYLHYWYAFLLFLAILRGVVWLFVFLFISVPISFQVYIAFKFLLQISKCYFGCYFGWIIR